MKATVKIETISLSFTDGRECVREGNDFEFEDFFKDEGNYLDRLTKFLKDEGNKNEGFKITYTVEVIK